MTPDQRNELLRRKAQLPIYQLFGLFGLNPYQHQLAYNERQQLQQKQDKTQQAVDSSIAGLDQLLQQMQQGRGDLFSLASSMALGKGASVLKSVAGTGGVAGSGLQVLGGSQLASSVLAQLANNIASNQLQRTQLQAGLLTGKAGLASGQEQLLMGWDELTKKYGQQDQSFLPKLLYSIAKSFMSGGTV